MTRRRRVRVTNQLIILSTGVSARTVGPYFGRDTLCDDEANESSLEGSDLNALVTNGDQFATC